MPVWREETLSDATQAGKSFAELAPQYHHQTNRWVFRGQGRYDWTLLPAFARHMDRRDTCWAGTVNLERAALEIFAREAHLVFGAGELPPDDNDPRKWWALMQHYGAPTRMLDWTRSPWPALYFACESEPGYDGAVWAVDAGALHDRLREHHSDMFTESGLVFNWFEVSGSKAIVMFTEAWQRTDRMAAQQGLFSYSNSPRLAHDPLFERLFANRPGEYTAKLRIPEGLKAAAKAMLRQMNLSGRTLFPGPDGLGRMITETVADAPPHELALTDLPGPDRRWK